MHLGDQGRRLRFLLALHFLGARQVRHLILLGVNEVATGVLGPVSAAFPSS